MYKDIRKIYFAFFALSSVLMGGILGYMLIENYSFLEALFMTVITMATVGYREVYPLSDAGMIFTVMLIISSFGIFAYGLTSFTQFILDGDFRIYLNDRKVIKKIEKLKKHTIICGFGRNGRQAAIELIGHKEQVLIIEKNQDIFYEPNYAYLLNSQYFVYVIGDATQDEIMQKARIQEAKALITTLPDDANNLFVVLTARTMNQSLNIVARASDDNSDAKLKRGGANHVIMPDKVGGSRMAKLVVEPDLIEFIENLMIRSVLAEVNLVEINCNELKACFINKSIQELHIRSRTGANLLGLKKDDNSYNLNPSPDTLLNSSYKLFVLGTNEQIDKLKQLFFEIAKS
jgi:voltage-gated potassium channel